jgi:hypothetical protein
MKIFLSVLLFSFAAKASWFTDPGFIDQAQLTDTEVQISVTLGNEINKQTSRRDNIKLESDLLKKSGVSELLLSAKLSFLPSPRGYDVYINKIKLGELDLSAPAVNGYFRVSTLPMQVSLRREGLDKDTTDTYTARFELSKVISFQPNFAFDRKKQDGSGWSRQTVNFAKAWLN